MKRILFAFCALAFLGCGPGDEPKPPAPPPVEPPPPPPPPPPPVEPPSDATATVTGKVLLRLKTPGTLPRRRKVQMAADAKCAAQHAELPLSDEEVVHATSDENHGAVQWAFVYVQKGLDGRKFPVPSEKPVLDQKGCMYAPHVLGVMAGQQFTIRNSDDLLHNIHAQPFLNQGFNSGQPSAGMEETKSFRTAEVAIKVKCDVHPWMGTWIAVVDHPFHAVTGEAGTFTLKDLPHGTYTLAAWHEKYGTVTREVTVRADADVTFTFEQP